MKSHEFRQLGRIAKRMEMDRMDRLILACFMLSIAIVCLAVFRPMRTAAADGGVGRDFNILSRVEYSGGEVTDAKEIQMAVMRGQLAEVRHQERRTDARR